MALETYLGFFNMFFEIDYMLESMLLEIYLLLLLKEYLYKIDEHVMLNTSNSIINNSQNNKLSVIRNYTNIQSAENCYTLKYESILPIRKKGFSETTRQLSNLSKYNEIGNNKEVDIKFWKYLAGVLDGDGNFDVSIKSNIIKLKEIRIKIHERDIRMITNIQNKLHIGRIRKDKNKPYVIYSITKKADMTYVFNNINGLIKLKLKNFKLGCEYLNIKFIESNYILEEYDPYFAGLVDTDGTIIYNYSGNRIECNIELQYNEYTSQLNLNSVIPNYMPYKTLRTKRITSIKDKEYKSIAFKFQTVSGMVYLYDYFLKNRLYSDFKFYRVTKIKKFIEIRDLKRSKSLIEYQVYKDFILDWIQYKNPLWYKVPFIDKLGKDIVHK